VIGRLTAKHHYQFLDHFTS